METWGVGPTAAFRAGVLLFVAYALPNVIVNPLVPWVGEHILGIEGPIPMELTGSGDTTADYVRAFIFVVFALGGCAVWSVAGSLRDRYPRGLLWLAFGVRIALATMMISYGFAKVFNGQFAPPSAGRLIQPIGEMSPMGLVWTFMGYSKAYCVFTGMAEVVGGLLVMSRRTQTLGAVVIVGVMANVVMLNFCYDIPVKLFSSWLLLMGVFLVALDSRRMLAVFVSQRATDARVLPRLYHKPRAHKAGQIAKALFLAVTVGMSIHGYLSFASQQENPADELIGIYEVETFVRDGVERAPLTTDTERWHRLAVGTWARATVQHMNGERKRYMLEVDPDAMTAVLREYKEGDTEIVGTYSYAWIEPGDDEAPRRLLLTSADTEITLRWSDPENTPLRSRGFHWVQEKPFNR